MAIIVFKLNGLVLLDGVTIGAIHQSKSERFDFWPISSSLLFLYLVVNVLLCVVMAIENTQSIIQFWRLHVQMPRKTVLLPAVPLTIFMMPSMIEYINSAARIWIFWSLLTRGHHMPLAWITTPVLNTIVSHTVRHKINSCLIKEIKK